ncbi:hypothetical protein [Reichenbachiella sp.]|uniref:hypothetical protein n=1 Tax=Reichenbachiella sp. TaxID=2184521 RepID=UPI0032979A1D
MSRTSRIHIAVNVTSLERSREFYTSFFGITPTKALENQIDWVLNNPPIHFSFYSSLNYPYGVEHIGFDFTDKELEQFKGRMNPDGINVHDPDHLKIEGYSSKIP